MKFSERTSRLAAAALLVGALLAGCGGGGGAPAGVGDPGAAAGASGLIPAAAAIGTTLADDATDWRPLRDKAIYTYQGKKTVQGANVTPDYFLDTIRQEAQGTGVREDSSNSFNEGPNRASTPVISQGGSIRQQVSFQVADGIAPIQLELVELKSPVRTNDRYVLLDRRLADIGVDVDGDKKNDAMDVAAWVDVIGSEVLDLPNRIGVKTIRTMTTVRARAVLSADGKLGPVIEERTNIWYARGIGPVKVQRDTPHPTYTDSRMIDEEILTTWDGVVEGLGTTLPLVSAFAPSPTAEFIPSPYAAAAFDSSVVTISNLPGSYSDAGFVLTQFDTRGTVVSSTKYTKAVTGGSAFGHRLFRVGNELRLLYIGSGGLRMLRFSADGQRVLASASTLLVADPLGSVPDYYAKGTYRVAVSAGTLWVLSANRVDSTTIDQARMELRHFGPDGQLIGTPMVLESGVVANSLGSVDMDASDRNVLLTWYRNIPVPGLRHLLLDGASGATVPVSTSGLSNLGPCTQQGLPLARDGANLITCKLNSSAATVALGVDGLAMTINGTVLTDTLTPADWNLDQGTLDWVVDPQNLSFFGPRYGRLWLGDQWETTYLQFAEVPTRGGRPDASGYRLLARVKGTSAAARFAFRFGNRILVIGSNCYCQDGVMQTMLVWR